MPISDGRPVQGCSSMPDPYLIAQPIVIIGAALTFAYDRWRRRKE